MGEETGTHYITMEYVPGEDLKSFIRRVGQIPVGKTIAIAKQICEGLSEAHGIGIVHRDLKPPNIMIDKLGNARILDFGIARSIETKKITGAGVMIGTPEYMSPEQVEGKETDQRSDIYALGVILYEMLTGRLPFEGETALSIAVQHRSDTAKDPKEFNPQIPDDLSRLILKCMEKEKDQRYQRVADILPSLTELAAQAHSTRIATTQDSSEKKPDTEKILEPEWKKSIAVLPFSNLSPEKEQEYFCDGLTEEIINALSHIRELRVVARTSAFAFKGKEVDIRDVGEKLNVDAVLEGSVRKSGDRIRITAQLINVTDGYHLWSERFDREMKDVFEIQDEVTLDILDKLKIELLGGEKARVVKRYTTSLEAHNLLLKGRYFLVQRTKEGMKKGLDCIHRALEIDPTYAQAYAYLSGILTSLGYYGFMRPKEAFPKARTAAQKALEIDSSLPQAYSALGWISLFYDWNWTAAERNFKKAISLNPGLDYAHWGYAAFLLNMGRLDEALQAHKKALEIDPLSLIMNANMSSLLRILDRYDEALEQLQKVLEMDPNFGLAYYYRGVFFSERGLYSEAIPEFHKAIELTGGLSWAFGFLGYAYAMLDRKDETEKILHMLEERSRDEYIRSTSLGLLYFGLGDVDKVFECLENAIEERDPAMSSMRIDPGFDDIRPDPRFQALLKKMGLE
jgi:TolB-like protein/Flp pilus assembly protein TadD